MRTRISENRAEKKQRLLLHVAIKLQLVFYHSTDVYKFVWNNIFLKKTSISTYTHEKLRMYVYEGNIEKANIKGLKK